MQELGGKGTVSELRKAILAKGLMAHDGGDLQQARVIYHSLLASDPNDSQVTFFLALATMQLGDNAEAEGLLVRALSVTPDDAGAWNYLCLARLNLNEAPAAVPAGRRSAICEEFNEDAHYNLGVALRACDKHASAVESLSKAVALNPGAWKAFNNLGLSFRMINDPRSGYTALSRATSCAPQESGPIFNLGTLLQEQGALTDALEMYSLAVNCIRLYAPDHPRLSDVCRNLGIVLTSMGRPDDACPWLAKSVCLSPEAVLSLNNYGIALKETAALYEAERIFERALLVDPKYAEAIWNKALLLLLTGKISEGFKLYEYRWKIPGLFALRPELASHRYNGHEAVSGRHVFLFAEQGLGDTMQFCRFSRRLVDLGAKVTLEVPAPLVELMRQSNVATEIVARGAAEPAADFHCPLMSLPAAWGLGEADLRMTTPYLVASRERVHKWGEIIARDSGVLNVGICWRGSTRYLGDASRSFGPERFSSLALRKNIVLYSLQQSDPAEQAMLAKLGIASFDEDFDRDGAFLDSIAVLEHLDLVITSDTAIAHLAAAAGKVTWVVLARVPDWRWMLDGEHSLWYPTVRLFRQVTARDWNGVFSEVERALDEWLGRPG